MCCSLVDRIRYRETVTSYCTSSITSNYDELANKVKGTLQVKSIKLSDRH